MFHFCQWCATPSTCYTISAEGAHLSIDEAALRARYTQFTASLENNTSTGSREAATTPLGQFLASRTTGGAIGMATAQPRDIVQFLCCLDSCSKRRRTVVLYAHDSLRTNYVFTDAISASPPTGAMLSGSAIRSKVIWSHNT